MKAATLVVVVAAGACMTLINPVKIQRAPGAPVLEARDDGCSVEIVDDGTPFTKPHQELGTIVLEWSATQMKDQGPEAALKTLRAAACEAGAHVVLQMRALPRGPNEGMVFDGTLAVLLDDKGQPLVGKATGTALSHGGTQPAAGSAP